MLLTAIYGITKSREFPRLHYGSNEPNISPYASHVSQPSSAATTEKLTQSEAADECIYDLGAAVSIDDRETVSEREQCGDQRQAGRDMERVVHGATAAVL